MLGGSCGAEGAAAAVRVLAAAEAVGSARTVAPLHSTTVKSAAPIYRCGAVLSFKLILFNLSFCCLFDCFCRGFVFFTGEDEVDDYAEDESGCDLCERDLADLESHAADTRDEYG